MVVLDTNIIIDHLRLQTQNHESALMEIVKNHPREDLAISIISIQELYEGLSTKESEKEQYLLATISPLKILPYTYATAQLAGEIARDLNRPVELADAAIAAAALLNNGSLYTLNKKDFLGIKNLTLNN